MPINLRTGLFRAAIVLLFLGLSSLFGALYGLFTGEILIAKTGWVYYSEKPLIFSSAVGFYFLLSGVLLYYSVWSAKRYRNESPNT